MLNDAGDNGSCRDTGRLTLHEHDAGESRGAVGGRVEQTQGGSLIQIRNRI